jgi:hypothetical protein
MTILCRVRVEHGSGDGLARVDSGGHDDVACYPLERTTVLALPPSHDVPPAVVVHRDAPSAAGDANNQIRSIRDQFAVAFTPGVITESVADVSVAVIINPPQQL